MPRLPFHTYKDSATFSGVLEAKLEVPKPWNLVLPLGRRQPGGPSDQLPNHHLSSAEKMLVFIILILHSPPTPKQTGWSCDEVGAEQKSSKVGSCAFSVFPEKILEFD